MAGIPWLAPPVAGPLGQRLSFLDQAPAAARAAPPKARQAAPASQPASQGPPTYGHGHHELHHRVLLLQHLQPPDARLPGGDELRLGKRVVPEGGGGAGGRAVARRASAADAGRSGACGRPGRSWPGSRLPPAPRCSAGAQPALPAPQRRSAPPAPQPPHLPKMLYTCTLALEDTTPTTPKPFFTPATCGAQRRRSAAHPSP